MYTFKIQDVKGDFIEFDGIEKVTYNNYLGDDVCVKGDDIFSHEYPTHVTLHLFSAKSTITVDKENVSVLEVVKEN